MPIDPSIIGRLQPVQTADPMQTLAQVYQLQNMRQQQDYQRERIELQRQEEARLGAAAEQAAREKAHAHAAGQALAPHLTLGETGSVRDFDIDGFINNLPPDQQAPARTMAQKWFDTQSEIVNRRATAKKTLQEVQAKQLEMGGQYARAIISANYHPQFSQGVLKLWASADPDFDPDAIWQQHGQDPESWKRYVDSVADATGDTVTLREGEKRVTPSGQVTAEIAPAPPKPDLVEEYDPVTKQTVKRYVQPTLGQSFLQTPPQAEGGGPVSGQLNKSVNPKTGQVDYTWWNPRTQTLERVETPYQPEQNVSEEIPANWRSTFDLAAAGLSKDKRENYERQLNQALTNTPPDKQPGAYTQLVRRAAIDSENVATKNDVNGRAQMAAALSDVEKGLNEMKAEGIPTNWFSGTAEDLSRKLGTSNNPAYVRMGVRLNTMLSNYTRAMSGVQFSEEEAKRYKQMFPNYKNTFVVNVATIQGIRDDMVANDRTYWEGKIGKDGARLIGIPEGSFTLRDTGPAATAGPKEGDTGRSRSGRATVYRNGQWVYQ